MRKIVIVVDVNAVGFVRWCEKRLSALLRAKGYLVDIRYAPYTQDIFLSEYVRRLNLEGVKALLLTADRDFQGQEHSIVLPITVPGFRYEEIYTLLVKILAGLLEEGRCKNRARSGLNIRSLAEANP